MIVWFGNGGLNVPAWPASVPIVSTPTPRMSRSSASSRDARASNPGLCGPSAATFANAAGSVRRRDPRCGRPERLRQIDDAHGAAREGVSELGQKGRRHSAAELLFFRRGHFDESIELGDAEQLAEPLADVEELQLDTCPRRSRVRL